ncbi:hypothetical protein PAL_GLEAN10020801 [Pteropus alecto]|uniref:Uncharacterized protein n=1 Tax=Pteropus alecto TaxID=9402 RepID=L5JQE0_PTEAL|nr:hypothetical protein PAL_GLEAN10020801 [Pteropus alecto]
MSAKAIESGEGVATDTFLQEFQSNDLGVSELSKEWAPAFSGGRRNKIHPSPPLSGLLSRVFSNPKTHTWALSRHAAPTSSEQPPYPHWSPWWFSRWWVNPNSGVCTPIKAPPIVQIRLRPVLVILCTMQGIATSFLAKMISSVSLANAGGVASSSILAGLPSVGLPLPSNAVLASTVSTLGSLLGTLEVFSPLRLPAGALSASPLGGNWPRVTDTPPWAPTQCTKV